VWCQRIKSDSTTSIPNPSSSSSSSVPPSHIPSHSHSHSHAHPLSPPLPSPSSLDSSSSARGPHTHYTLRTRPLPLLLLLPATPASRRFLPSPPRHMHDPVPRCGFEVVRVRVRVQQCTMDTAAATSGSFWQRRPSGRRCAWRWARGRVGVVGRGWSWCGCR